MNTYRLYDWSGNLIIAHSDMELMTRWLHAWPFAAQLTTEEGVLLRFKLRGCSLLALVGYGEHAGAPRGTDAAWCAGMN